MINQFQISDMFQDTKGEAGLLAAMIQNPEIYFRVIDYVPPEVWTAEKQTFRKVALAIEKGENLLEIDLPDAEPVPDPVATAKRLGDLYQRRKIASLIESKFDDLHNEEKTVPGIVQGIETGLNQVQQSILETRAGHSVPVTSLFDNVLEQVQARYDLLQKGHSVVGLPTGLKTLDSHLGGLQKGVHVLAAEPGQGKTSLTLQLARHVTSKGYPVLFVSFEEALDRLALKLLCSSESIPFKRFTDGYGQAKELEPVAHKYHDQFSNLHFVEGTSRVSVAQIKAKALQLMTQTKSDRCLIIVDYLQRWANIIDPELLSEAERDGGRNMQKDFRFVVGRLSAQLRDLSMRLNSPVVLISSQNRGGQGSDSLTSLKESGDLEYGADSAMFLTKSNERTTSGVARAVDLTIRKNRYGDIGKVELIFRPDIGTFREESK